MKEPNELDEYLREVIKNDEKCKNCILKHEDNVCFFAYECIKNNHNHFKSCGEVIHEKDIKGE